MGWFDDWFSSGEIQEQAEVKSQTNFPQWYNRLNQANLLRATEASLEPYQAYGGPRQALSGPNEVAARQGLHDVAGIAAPYFTEAMDQSRLGSAQFAGTDMRPYMSPFQQGVTDIALREARKEGDLQSNRLASNATKAGAFGGSRAVLEQMENQSNTQQNLGDIQATGSQRAYDSALAQLGFDRDAAARASTQMGALGTGLQANMTSGLKESELAAIREKAERQGALDISYQDFLAQRQYPMSQASGLQSLLTGASVPGSSIQTTYGQPPSVGGQIGGMAMAGLGALGGTGAFGEGGWLWGGKDGGEVPVRRYEDGNEVEGLDQDRQADLRRRQDEMWPPVEDESEDPNYVTGASPVEKALNYILRAAQLATNPGYAGQLVGEAVGPGITEAVESATTRPRFYLDQGESGGPSSDPDAGLTPLLAGAMAGDPEDSVVNPTSDPDPVTSDSESGGFDFDYDLLLELGLGMMAAGAVPGSTIAGSIGQGGLAALQGRREADALTRKEDLENRKLAAIIKANEQDYHAVFASLDQDQRQEVVDIMVSRQSDLLEALADPTFAGPAKDVAQEEYDDLTSAIDNLIYPGDLPMMNAGLDE
tara:strand:- start:312 stop:2096 length:1785 start_codon:yes stop_codon:yes gene_type:complete